ncbi:hypothetical protein, partial [[Ruminococcus] lactaris]|uniref:hypothetical protein n=1 Tax=[Ruminococcus] lactaris TaxID=46228 RepID=UPI0022E5DAAF
YEISIKFVVVGVIRYKESANFSKADRTWKAGYSFAVQSPLYLSPLTVCNSKVEMIVQRHSHLLSLTNAAKCLRNAPANASAQEHPAFRCLSQ